MENLTKKNKDNRYEFILEDGQKIVLKKDDKIEYNGKIRTASKLFDALKSSYRGIVWVK